MRIVLVNHGTAGEWGGGDSVQIKKTAEKLIQRGYEVSIQNADSPDVRKADVVHIFNCRVFKSFKQQVATAQAAGKPIVVSPIWIHLGRAIWGSRGTFGVLKKGVVGGEDSIHNELRMLKHRSLQVNLDSGYLMSDGKGTYDLKWVEEMSNILSGVNAILPNSWLELKAVQTDLNWQGNKFRIAPYGVDPKIFMDADEKLFRDYSGIKGDFVLQAGRIEAGKNQAMLCWALRNTNIKVVLIGGTKHWPAYAELCKDILGDRVHIIEHLPTELLASAYAAARVHSLVSWMDTCGLVSLEAGINGTPVVGSTFGHELEYLRNDAWLANPGDPENIKQNILEAWEAGKYNKKSVRLKERIMTEFNWEITANETEKIYEMVT